MASSHQAYLAHAHALSHAQQLPSASAAYMTPHAHQHLPSMTSTAMASRAQLTGAPPPPPASTPTSTSARPAGKQLTQQQLAQQQRNLTPWSKVDKKGWQYA